MGKVTQKQIEDWKKEHGDVYGITVGKITGYFKKPNRMVMGFASSLKPDMLAYKEAILKGSFIGGNDAIYKQDDCFYAACVELDKLLEFQAVEVKAVKKDKQDVYRISANEKIAYISQPSRKDVATMLMLDDDVKKAEYLLDKCWLSGDECFKEEDEYFLPIHSSVEFVLGSKRAAVGKL